MIQPFYADAYTMSYTWYHYLIGFLTGFMAPMGGIVFGLLSQKFFEIRKRRKKARYMVERLKEELEKVRNEIKEAHELPSKEFAQEPILMPAFKGFVASSTIELLDGSPWYDDLFELYDKLEEYNKLQDLKTSETYESYKAQKKFEGEIKDEESLIYLTNKKILKIEKSILGIMDMREEKLDSFQYNGLSYENVSKYKNEELALKAKYAGISNYGECVKGDEDYDGKRKYYGLINCISSRMPQEGAK